MHDRELSLVRSSSDKSCSDQYGLQMGGAEEYKGSNQKHRTQLSWPVR